MTDPTLIPLEAAMEQFKLAPETRPLVRQIALRAGVIGCEVKSSYIKAFREDGMHALHIGKRATEWFGSRAEAVAASDLPDRVREGKHGAGLVNWALDYPIEMRAPSARVARAPKQYVSSAAETRDYGVCEVCWQARTPSGTCGCD